MQQCPECGENFKRVAGHWVHYPEHRQNFTSEQHEIITGLLMGDGSLDRVSGRSPRLQVSMITKEFLEWLSRQFGLLGKDVFLSCTAQESYERASRSDWDRTSSKAYSDVYKFRTMRHPELQLYTPWYSSGSKVWPSDIALTPTVLSMWYVSDGTYDVHDRSRGSIRIGSVSASDNKEKIRSYFSSAGLPEPNRWREGHGIVWNADESEKLLNYMGDPLPGFEYKWPK